MLALPYRQWLRAIQTACSAPETTGAAASLGFFRIGIALLSLVQLWLVSDQLLLLYGHLGLMQWVISDTVKSPYLPSLGPIATYLQPVGLTGDQYVYLASGLYTFCLLALLVGWQTRLAAIGAWLTQMTLTNSSFFSVYGVDTMLSIGLFHCAWMPVGGAYAVDQYLFRRRPPAGWYTQFALTVLRVHVCIIYLNTGLLKMAGEQWWTGEAIWRAFMQPQFHHYDWTWLAQVPWLARVIGWSTLLIEAGYALLIWPSRTRPYWVLATLLLHLGIGLILGLWLFALVMMLLTVAAFGFPYLYAYRSRLMPFRFYPHHAILP